jgi:hypothetical protein
MLEAMAVPRNAAWSKQARGRSGPPLQQPNAEVAEVTQKSQRTPSKGIPSATSAKFLRPLRSEVALMLVNAQEP